MHSRRDFLKAGSAALAYGSTLLSTRDLFAKTLNLPLGLQLYSVRQLLPKDYNGTLKQVAALGYRQVEAAGFYDHSVAEVKQAMQDAGLDLLSAHYSSDDLHAKFDEILAFSKGLGLSYIICSFPGYKDPARIAKIAPRDRINAFTLEDWRWNAEEFNKFGEKVHAAGMKFGYHNHYMEFHPTDGVVPYTELLRLTDPAKVTMEMDCGWVIVGGGNPVEYLRKYPRRITMLHVKDFKIEPGSTPGGRQRFRIAEMGQGSIDYVPIFREAAKAGHVRHCFVEQEGFDMPPMESLKIDAEYVQKVMES